MWFREDWLNYVEEHTSWLNCDWNFDSIATRLWLNWNSIETISSLHYTFSHDCLVLLDLVMANQCFCIFMIFVFKKIQIIQITVVCATHFENRCLLMASCPAKTNFKKLLAAGEDRWSNIWIFFFKMKTLVLIFF